MPLPDSLKRSADSAEFVTTAEMQTYLRLPTTGSNGLVANAVAEARQQVERDTRRCYLQQTWVYKLDAFPTSMDSIELPRPPLKSVDSISYIATTGNSVTWSSTNYEVDTNRTPGVVWLKYDIDWPATRSVQNAVTITYKAGYSTAASGVPSDAKRAVKMLASDYFCHGGIDGPTNRESYMNLIQGLRWGDYQ